MLKFHVRWRENPKAMFKSPEEREEFMIKVLGEVKAVMQAGLIKDFGTFTDGSGGYAIFEVPSESDVFVSIQRWVPQVNFDVKQVLTLEQFVEARKAAASLSGKQTP